MRILGIDDNRDIGELLESVLTGMGHEYAHATSGRDGISMIRSSQYDIVLLDLAMPDFSGFDVVDSLCNENLMKKQKVIIFTASSGLDKEINQLMSKGVSACIKKPVDLDLLLDTINQMESSGS